MLQVDLERPTAVTGILTQGASRLGVKMWVTSFKIAYSKDGRNYKEFDKVCIYRYLQIYILDYVRA